MARKQGATSKSNKTLSKRVRVTKNGKVMRTSPGVGHFRLNKTASKLSRRAKPKEGHKSLLEYQK